MALRLPRIIPRLAIKGPNVVCTINLEGLRVVGKPAELARRYAEQGADELLYIDSVASLYGRSQLTEILKDATKDVFIPITVGGGIRSRADAQRLLDAGADSVAINTAAIRTPALISDLASHYGSQAITVAIEAKKCGAAQWECYTDNGREKTGKDVIAWAQESVARGAGELLLTSIDQEGTRKGFDVALWRAVEPLVGVPVVLGGGMGRLEHLDALRGGAHGVTMASVLHYGLCTVPEMRAALGHERTGFCRTATYSEQQEPSDPRPAEA